MVEKPTPVTEQKPCDHNVPGRKWGQACPACGVVPTAVEWQGDANERPKTS